MGHCILAVFVLLVAACGFGKSFPLAEEVGKDSNGTITDETLRKLLGMIGEFVEPVQAIPDYGYSSNSSDSTIFAQANGTSVTDLTDYTITVAHADMTNLEFQLGLKFPALNLSGHYKMYVDDDILHLVGNGPFEVNITSFSLFVNLTFQLNTNKTLEMKDISSDFDFDRAKVNFVGLGEDEEICAYLNDFINEFIADSMIELKPTVMELVKEKLIPLGNFFIGGMTLDEFINYVNSLA
ncbi:JHBP [Nesidiocoris tenuis]|uniref:JHBP n=1 Tax=Nesidiocoris tenuis TaxID=355587 RepID=A0ABN7A7H8_9HEMI|nr:JHBP [Nesidiocoris tenuis]